MYLLRIIILHFICIAQISTIIYAAELFNKQLLAPNSLIKSQSLDYYVLFDDSFYMPAARKKLSPFDSHMFFQVKKEQTLKRLYKMAKYQENEPQKNLILENYKFFMENQKSVFDAGNVYITSNPAWHWKRFNGKRVIFIKDIELEWLRSYEQLHRASNNSESLLDKSLDQYTQLKMTQELSNELLKILNENISMTPEQIDTVQSLISYVLLSQEVQEFGSSYKGYHNNLHTLEVPIMTLKFMKSSKEKFSDQDYLLAFISGLIHDFRDPAAARNKEFQPAVVEETLRFINNEKEIPTADIIRNLISKLGISLDEVNVCIRRTDFPWLELQQNNYKGALNKIPLEKREHLEKLALYLHTGDILADKILRFDPARAYLGTPYGKNAFLKSIINLARELVDENGMIFGNQSFKEFVITNLGFLRFKIEKEYFPAGDNTESFETQQVALDLRTNKDEKSYYESIYRDITLKFAESLENLATIDKKIKESEQETISDAVNSGVFLIRKAS